ncbi:MAG: Sec-independent protein translocase subunit TatA [Mycobacteriaceae bacterium]
MGSLSIWHWMIVLVVLVVLFGAKRLPDASRSLGRSLRIFKSEMQEMGTDGKKSDADRREGDHAGPQQPPATPAPQQLPAAPPVVPAAAPPASPNPTQHVQAERVEKAS